MNILTQRKIEIGQPAPRRAARRLPCLVLTLLPVVVEADLVDWIAADGAWENPANWSSGALPGDADFATIAHPGLVSSTASDNVALELVNHSLLTVSAGILGVTGTVDTHGALEVVSGGRVDAGRIQVQSAGALLIDGAGSAAEVTGGVFSSGSLRVTDAGRLGSESFDNFADWQVEQGGQATANSMINHVGATLAVSGAGSRQAINGNLTNNGSVALDAAGTLETDSADNFGDVAVTAGGAYVTGSLINDGSVSVSGAGSSWQATDVVTNHADLTVGDAASTNLATLDNRGTTTVENAALGAGVLDNVTGALLRAIAGATVTVDDLARNAGTVHIDANSALETGRFLQLAGATLLEGGVLGASLADGVAFAGGELAGIGTIDGLLHVSADAVVAPGLAADATGRLDVLGDLALAGGTLAIDLEGTASGDYDLLAVSGGITLGGTLGVELGGGLSLAAGDFFDILTADHIDGLFDALLLPVLGDGLVLTPINGGTYLRLAVTAVPIPAPVVLLAGALGLLRLSAYRRTASRG